MKNLLTFQKFLKINLFLFIIILSNLSQAQTNCPEGMVSFWKFDEGGNVNTFFDSFGGINASCSDCPIEDIGVISRARNFNGINEVTAPANIVFNWENGSSFSIEAWIKTLQPGTGNKVFVGKYRGGTNMAWWLGFGDNNKAIFSVRDSSGIYFELEGNIIINDGNWHHIVGVRNADMNVLQVFVDGVKENEVSTNFTGNFSGTNPVYIGYFINSLSPYHFNGLLDEVAIYNAILNENEVTNHYNNGLQGINYCNEPTDVRKNENFPGTYSLSQNYPNPFNPVTKIKFSIPERQIVSIRIFNQLGEEINYLINSEYEAGSYEVEFNAGNLASGVYFYRMETGSFSSAMKLLLLK